jgi:hypothetical protein
VRHGACDGRRIGGIGGGGEADEAGAGMPSAHGPAVRPATAHARTSWRRVAFPPAEPPELAALKIRAIIKPGPSAGLQTTARKAWDMPERPVRPGPHATARAHQCAAQRAGTRTCVSVHLACFPRRL